MTSRNYCFTIYPEKEPEFKLWEKLPETAIYMVFQYEKCPKTEKIHLQGYIEFDTPHRLKRAKELIGSNTIHLEKRKGTRDQARNYCMKTDTRIAGPFELGIWSNKSQGKRNDLEEVADAIKTGADYKTIFEINPGACIRYGKGIDRAIAAFEKNEFIDKHVEVYWGPTHTGKSYAAWELCGLQSTWSKPKGQWFDGYEGQENVIIDEFMGDIEIGLLLQMLDRYPLRVQTKGGFRNWKPKRIIITSNINPEEWYPGIREESKGALMRRLKVIKNMTQKFVK